MPESIFDRIRAIDTDSHITEPPDVWKARVPAKWRDAVPQIRNVNGADLWVIGDQMMGGSVCVGRSKP